MPRTLTLCLFLLGNPALAAVPDVVPADAAPGALSRTEFNRRAAELNLPLFWRSDANGNHAIDPAELAVLWGVAGGGQFTDYVEASAQGGRFTARFHAAWWEMLLPADDSQLAPLEQRRRQAVREELAQGRPTLIETDLRGASAEDRALVRNITAAAAIIERIYAKQRAVDEFASRIPADDPASAMLFYRNQSPFCETPRMEGNPDCNAVADRPRKRSGLYPANLQAGGNSGFCGALEKRSDATKLLDQFSVIVAKPGGRSAGDAATDDFDTIPYHRAYQAEMTQVAALLAAAAAEIHEPREAALKSYLEAAAANFLSNDWRAADEAWARMDAQNSRWYLRIAPDENYDEPCSRKSMFHVSFARINPEGIAWQRRLEPRKAAMEATVAKLAGPPYQARVVSFHLPDFIDIVLNAGDSRYAQGAVIGQSLPNGGPVANEGRGRTVAMANLYTDRDSETSWRATASSLLCRRTMARTSFDPRLTVMSSVLHEASHNLGPSYDYRVDGRTAPEIFGGSLASTLEELKAQTAGLYFTDWLVGQRVIAQASANRAHLGDVEWAFGHIAQGMYDSEGKPKPYSQLAAIQMGTYFRQGVLAWHSLETAANGSDRGCFDVDLTRWKATTAELAARVLHIKGAGDKVDAEALKAEFVDNAGEWARLKGVIRERHLRAPKASFVYAIEQ